MFDEFGVILFNPGGFGQDLINAGRRQDHRTRCVGVDLVARNDRHTANDHGAMCLERHKSIAAPARDFTNAVNYRLLPDELAEIAYAAVA